MVGGFVALLDVLGFSSLVAGDEQSVRLQRYLECLRATLGKDDVDAGVDYVVFSDSIVLTTRGPAQAELQILLRRCSWLLGSMLENEIPLRGAISFGPYFHSAVSGGTFVAGKAIIDAHTFEKAQDWVGVMLAPSALRQVPDLAELCKLESENPHRALETVQKRIAWAAFVQPYRQIPFHSTHPFDTPRFDGFAVVPTSGAAEPTALRDSTQRCLKALEWLKALAPDPAAQAKYTASQQLVREVSSQWADVVRWIERRREQAT